METKDEHIINKFREMLEKRYRYEDLVKRFDIPTSITEETIAEVKHYFLNTIYPPAVERKQLEDAFRNLAVYVRSPKKIWGLFGNMTGAIFKFGRHFMSALKAGFGALDSFMGAKKFEQSMADIANKNGILPPISDDDFEETMYQLPREEIEKFIGDVKGLFGAMVNTELLRKTLAILDNVIETMDKKPNTYPKADVDGIRLGRGLLEKGYELFSKYDEPAKNAIVEFIFKNEMWYIDYIYQKKEGK
ncbi:MAG: hypothetical protein U0U67_06355 [Chitinophagales bacterium]